MALCTRSRTTMRRETIRLDEFPPEIGCGAPASSLGCGDGGGLTHMDGAMPAVAAGGLFPASWCASAVRARRGRQGSFAPPEWKPCSFHPRLRQRPHGRDGLLPHANRAGRHHHACAHRKQRSRGVLTGRSGCETVTLCSSSNELICRSQPHREPAGSRADPPVRGAL